MIVSNIQDVTGLLVLSSSVFHFFIPFISLELCEIVFEKICFIFADYIRIFIFVSVGDWKRRHVNSFLYKLYLGTDWRGEREKMKKQQKKKIRTEEMSVDRRPAQIAHTRSEARERSYDVIKINARARLI